MSPHCHVIISAPVSGSPSASSAQHFPHFPPSSQAMGMWLSFGEMVEWVSLAVPYDVDC